jgi:putative ABC transport system permease protein
MERSAEIGVRKAFGAHSGSILAQLVFENVVLTFLGGVLGWVFALTLIYLVNDSQVLGDTQLQFNTAVFLYSLLICLVFGILSGLLPAYRMSKLHIVNAIKFNAL